MPTDLFLPRQRYLCFYWVGKCQVNIFAFLTSHQFLIWTFDPRPNCCAPRFSLLNPVSDWPDTTKCTADHQRTGKLRQGSRRSASFWLIVRFRIKHPVSSPMYWRKHRSHLKKLLCGDLCWWTIMVWNLMRTKLELLHSDSFWWILSQVVSRVRFPGCALMNVCQKRPLSRTVPTKWKPWTQ